MPSSPLKSTVNNKQVSPSQVANLKKLDIEIEQKAEETVDPSSMEPPPLEKLTVDLTNDNGDSSDSPSNNKEDDDESAHSLIFNKENKTPNAKQENDDDDGEEEDSDDDDDDSDDESSDDDDDEMFAGLSKEERAKMKAAMGCMQAGYEETEAVVQKEKIEEIQRQILFNLNITINDETALFIHQFVTENNQNLEQELENEGILFLESMSEMLEQKKSMDVNDNNNTDYFDDDNDYQFPDSDPDDEAWVANEKKRKAARAQKRKGTAKNTNLDGSKRCGRLLLKDLLANVKDQTGWSDARKKAWKNRKTSPNAYFYRFNVPGVDPKNGKWSKAEHILFMKRVLEFGVNDQWGIFSKKIPGRVGYQCSNYWRGLVKDGDVTDPNYHYDGKKLHFKRHTKTFSISTDYRRYAITINRDDSGVWKDLPCKHPKHPSDKECMEVEKALGGQQINNNKNKKKRKRNDGDDDDDDDEDWNAGKKTKRRRKTRRRANDDDDDEAFYCKSSTTDNTNNKQDDNPLPDVIDAMTGMTVIKPAISPYGHVLGYDTWTKLLRTSKHKNICPFTLQKLTRRSLVKLTTENIEDYRDKIINISKEQIEMMAQLNKAESNE